MEKTITPVFSVLSPSTYLNHLSLEDGAQYELARNIELVLVGVSN